MAQSVSLVLSGGGARGIAHIGVIEELESYGYSIGSVTGTSMGALVGAVYVQDKLEDFKQWLFTLDKIKILNLIDFTFSSQGLVKGDKILKKLEEFIIDEDIENMRIPYTAVATDIKNKKEVVFKKGSIYEAIRASISIPTVFTPVEKENSLLVDGGVLNNIPVKYAEKKPGDILMAVNVNAEIPLLKPKIAKSINESRESAYKNKIKNFQEHLQKIFSIHQEEKMGYFDLVNTTIGLMTNQLTKISLEKYSPDLLIEISRDACGMFDFYKAEELVEIGRYATQKQVKEYNKNA